MADNLILDLLKTFGPLAAASAAWVWERHKKLQAEAAVKTAAAATEDANAAQTRAEAALKEAESRALEAKTKYESEQRERQAYRELLDQYALRAREAADENRELRQERRTLAEENAKQHLEMLQRVREANERAYAAEKAAAEYNAIAGQWMGNYNQEVAKNERIQRWVDEIVKSALGQEVARGGAVPGFVTDARQVKHASKPVAPILDTTETGIGVVAPGDAAREPIPAPSDAGAAPAMPPEAVSAPHNTRAPPD